MKRNTASDQHSAVSMNFREVRDDPENRRQMIAITAYFRAEKRGFSPNNELADWLEAEREIERHLGSFK